MVTNIENSQPSRVSRFYLEHCRQTPRSLPSTPVPPALIVLRRLDAVLEPTSKAVLEAMGLEGDAFSKAIAKVAIGGDRFLKG